MEGGTLTLSHRDMMNIAHRFIGGNALVDGRPAFISVLQAAKERVGQDRQTYCEMMIHAVQREFAE